MTLDLKSLENRIGLIWLAVVPKPRVTDHHVIDCIKMTMELHWRNLYPSQHIRVTCWGLGIVDVVISTTNEGQKVVKKKLGGDN
jgi:hypothetical protein